MEGILLDIGTLTSPIAVLSGLVLLGVAACGILVGRMADEEAKGRKVFWAESPFTDISEAVPEEREYLEAA